MKKKSILCVVAHPDDEALGPGGSLINHSSNGDDVFILIFSDGEGSKNEHNKSPNRLEAARNWSQTTNCELLNIFDFSDQMMDSIPQLKIVKLIEKNIAKVKPDIVYTHFPSDINKDHEVIGKATLVALRPMKFMKKNIEIRAFETPSSTEQSPYISNLTFLPNLYISIENSWKKKLEALQCYASELGKFPHPRSLKSIEALAIKRGAESGLKKAEAFMILKKTIS